MSAASQYDPVPHPGLLNIDALIVILENARARGREFIAIQVNTDCQGLQARADIASMDDPNCDEALILIGDARDDWEVCE